MMKLVLLCVLTYFILQASNALPREELRSSNVEELITGLKKQIHDTSVRFGEVLTEMRNKLSEVENGTHLSGLVEDFRRQMDVLIHEDRSDVCRLATREQVREVKNLAIALSRETYVNDKMDDLKNQMEIVTSKMRDLLSEINNKVIRCISESKDNRIELDHCIDNKFADNYEKAKSLRKEVTEILNTIEKSLPDFNNGLLASIQDKKDKLTTRIQEAWEKLQKCINESNLSSRKSVSIDLNNIQEQIIEMKDILRETSNRFDKLFAETREKVKLIESKFDFPRLLDDFRQQITEILAMNKTDSCELIVRQQFREAENLSVVSNCRPEIDDEFRNLRKQLVLYNSRIGGMLQELNRESSLCMEQTRRNKNLLRKCIEPKLVVTRRQIESIKEEIDETFNAFQESLQESCDKVSICADNMRDKLSSKLDEAKEKLQNCVNRNNTVTFVVNKRSGSLNIVEFIEYLVGLMNELKVDVTDQQPAELLSLEEKINEIIWRHNIDALIVGTKITIENIFKETWRNERLCGSSARENLHNLARNAHIAVERCASQTREESSALENKFFLLTVKIRSLAEKLNEEILDCVKLYPNNKLESRNCLENRAKGLRKEVAQLQQEVRETREDAVQIVRRILNNLNLCLNEVENGTTNQGEIVVGTLNTCVANAN